MVAHAEALRLEDAHNSHAWKVCPVPFVDHRFVASDGVVEAALVRRCCAKVEGSLAVARHSSSRDYVDSGRRTGLAAAGTRKMAAS